jgi:uncharacterized membrane protein
MKEDVKQHVLNNREQLSTWLKMGEPLQIGSDVLKPLITPFNEKFPDVNLYGNCKSCILDMIAWALSKIEDKPEIKKKK